MLRTFLVLLCFALLVSACGIDHADIGVERSLLYAVTGGTTPADSTEYLHDSRGLPVVVSFNREFEAGEIAHIEIVPRPLSMGEVQAPGDNPRQLLIDDVVLDPRHGAYRLLLDGPAMPAPLVLSYFSARNAPLAGSMDGHIEYPRRGRDAGEVLIYAVVPQGREGEVELTGTEDTLFGQPVVGATISLVVSTQEGGWFRLSGLKHGARYVVVGILDSNRDGQYDLTEDWWGYYREENGEPIEVIALAGLETFLRVDFALIAPGYLDSPW